MTCEGCGASLPEGARWCSLCFAPVRVAASAVAAEPRSEPGRSEVAATMVEAAPAEPDADVAETDWYVTGSIGEHQLIASGAQRAWRCGVCGHSDWLDEVQCPVCGTSLFSVEETRESDHRADPGRTLRWSAIPGGGLFHVGLRVQGMTMGALVALCAASAFMFPRRGATLFGVVVFAICAVVLWAVAARDAREVAITGQASSMLVHGRRLFWVALGILGLLLATGVLALVVGAMSQPSSNPVGA